MLCRAITLEVRECFLFEIALNLTYFNLVTRFSQTGVATVFAGTGITGMDRSPSHKAQKINIHLGYLDGAAANAQFNNSFGISLDQFGTAYLADSGNNMIRQISTSGIVTTLAGGLASGFANGLGPDARFNFPEGVLADNRKFKKLLLFLNLIHLI